MTTKEKNAAKKDRVKREIARRERLFKKASNAERRVLMKNIIKHTGTFVP